MPQERPSFTAPQNDPSLPFPLSHQIKNPCNLLSHKHYHLAYFSFITHIYLTLWTKRCVGKDTCKRKKRKKKRIKWAKRKSKNQSSIPVITNANQCQNPTKPRSNKKQESKKHTAHRGSLHNHQAFFNPQTTASHYNHKSPLTRGIVQIIIKNYDGLIPKGYVGSLFSRSDPITQ